jgi:gamma-glutamylcyclotransferase (GGCT)/AIG2-like uncharacterized protein YtfP
MQHRVFVYGTLLQGEVNHHLLADAVYLGPHRTARCFSLFLLGAYPGAVRGGLSAISGECYGLDTACLRRLDRLEDSPRLYDRTLIASPYGRAWMYLYRGSLEGRALIAGGDWRGYAADPSSPRAAGVRQQRDPKTRRPVRSHAPASGRSGPPAVASVQGADRDLSHPMSTE